MNELKEYTERLFEDIKHIDENGNEFWYARELQMTLGYKRWYKFCNVIEEAKIVCKQSNNLLLDHFTQVGKMIKLGKEENKNVIDYKLSRYACYLIAQNTNFRKKVIVLIQIYFFKNLCLIECQTHVN